METLNTPWWERRAVWIALVLASAIPLLWPVIPPLVDVPGHMGRYRVMLGTDAAVLGQWYSFHWKPIGYLGVDLLVATFAPLVGLELAVKLIVIAIPMLAVSGMLWISREAHGCVQPLALFALPLAYNFAFQFGFLNFCLSMALALNAFALWLRLGRLEKIGLRAAIFVPLSCLIWIAHLFGWLVLGLLAFTSETMRQRNRHGWITALFRAGLLCLPLALPFAMFLFWRPGGNAPGSDWLMSLKFKFGWLIMILRDRWQRFDIASVTVIALVIYYAIRTPGFGQARAVTAAALGMLALFVAMPFGAAYADMRLAPYAVILAVLAVRAGEGVPPHRRAGLALVGLAFFGARTAATTASFYIESQSWNRHLTALDHVPRGASMVSFVGVQCAQPWSMARLGHLPGMAIVRRAAFSNDQYDLGSTALLMVTAPGIADFATDPSQFTLDRPCAGSAGIRTLADAMARLPRDRFDYIWLINPSSIGPHLTTDTQLIWSNGSDRLLRITRARGAKSGR